MDAIVDSGACMTCVPSGYIDRMNAPIYGRRLFRGAVGSPEYKMTFFVDIRIGEHQFEGLEVVAIDNKKYALIGRDILNQRKITLDGNNRMWSIDFNETNENY
ncbi:retroviral-like aspartic protease family protein [Nostoc sp. ChiVER01]|uniref:retroviral-like aspartic protease family protein n=1 Tax=Nostoc sp. ChiVER01 TaxID=3075382 RepID=UPI002AD4E6BD|nr:retroviral-like aspartic protease family protein [Nostoc sp. ChiVER01]MDZ8222547.1 retroviral-like aspartic protease family protein [Nostoc sp. ChiVER01]